ncbi:MAG: hypothetical protein HYR60_02210 [Acidobacteria bacterium]|nr:hypothetical protein [Acidobacteriota bacterium]
MTKENLLQRGKPFVDGFTAAIAQHIRDRRWAHSSASRVRASWCSFSASAASMS